jgi:hypothetical protein
MRSLILAGVIALGSTTAAVAADQPDSSASKKSVKQTAGKSVEVLCDGKPCVVEGKRPTPGVQLVLTRDSSIKRDLSDSTNQHVMESAQQR